MKVHFIAIGGSVMHQLAIALSRKGYEVTGSDDEIFEPALANLQKEGLLPPTMGWDPGRIQPGLDAVILGMHAKGDNPELQRALELSLPIYSFPEYIYQESRDKKRVVALPRQLQGDALALMAGVLWGLTTLVIRSSRLATASPEKMLFYQVGITALLAPLASWSLGETWSLSYSARAWGSIGLQAAVGGFASFLAWMWLLRHYPATRLSSFSFLTPVFALLFAVAMLGEPLTWQLMLAAAGVALGIVLVNRRGPA